jgi:alkaline phosphatase D
VLGMAAAAGSLAFARSSATTDPFTLGVASGEPRHDSVVLWTRLAPDPLTPGAGLPAAVDVEWELATDQRMQRVVRRGTERATSQEGHSVHALPCDLEPGREYWYRFKAGGHISATGRTKTLPVGSPAAFDFAVASCQNFVSGYYTAHRYLADDNVDLVLFLGDYIYETSRARQPVRTLQVEEEPVGLDAYRTRYAEYKLDSDLQAAHASAPFVCVWDDHEVKNDYAGLIPQPASTPDFAVRRAAAYQACYENLPMRHRTRIYHRFAVGDLATFHMLDTRQYRHDQPCDSGVGGDAEAVGDDCAQRHDPARTILGTAQRAWLLDGLRQSRAKWNLLGQQVMFAQMDHDPAVDKGLWEVDGWDGYTADRRRVTEQLARTSNPVVFTGDLHNHVVADIKTDFDNPAAPVVATEFVVSGISSPSFLKNGPGNPHIKFFSGRNGYLRTSLRTGELRTEVYSMSGNPVLPDSIRETEATYVVEAGRPGAARS